MTIPTTAAAEAAALDRESVHQADALHALTREEIKIVEDATQL
jgi:hypothetical protein